MAYWKDHMLDTHIAAKHESYVPATGNASQEPSGPPGLPGWLIARMAEEAAIKRAERKLAEEAAHRLREVERMHVTDAFFRSKGVKLKPGRGGSFLK